MIWTPLTVIILLVAVLGIPLTVYTAFEASKIMKKRDGIGLEEFYVLEKRYYLLSTVVGVVFVSRLIVLGLFWMTLESLVPLIPGAMCIWGVLQAGSPYSWVDVAIKLLVVFLYGTWLVMEVINRRVKNVPLMQTLSRAFISLLPFLFIDVGADIAFFGRLIPISVPCCAIFFTPSSILPCPFCFIFHEAPFMIGAIAGYGLTLASIIWGLALKRYTNASGELGTISRSTVQNLSKLSLASAIMATSFLIPALLQVISTGGFYH